MFQGFKDFVMRGNVVELAVAVVIGGVFGAIVTAFVDYIVNPLIGAFVRRATSPPGPSRFRAS